MSAGEARRRVEQIMGMPIGIDVRDEDVPAEALDRAFDWFRWVDATFSTYREDSEISRINRGELSVAGADPRVREVLERCERFRFATSGYFDIRVAGLPAGVDVTTRSLAAAPLDPSGLVKGWSVDEAARILEEAGARNYSINAGGDIALRGRPEPGMAWRVGIQHPLQRDKLAAVVEATDTAIATSGAYERGEHVFDPHTGAAPREVLSVTIVGPELATADTYATAAFAMDAAGPAWTAQLPGYEAMTIMAEGTVLSTPGFPFAADSATGGEPAE